RDAAQSAVRADAGGEERARREGRLHRFEQRRLLARRRAPEAREDVAMGRRATTDREPACRLVRFEATDGVGLAGLLFEPHVGRASARRRGDGLKPVLHSAMRPALIWLHGTGGASIFESRRTNLLAAAFLARG